MRENRSVTVDFGTEEAYYRLLTNGRAFIKFIIAFVMSIGFQFKHRLGCSGSFFYSPFPLCTGQPERCTDMAHSMQRMRCSSHSAAAFCATVPENESRNRCKGAHSHSWRSEPRTYRRDSQYLSHVRVPADLMLEDL